jgi:hypothetical protein
MSFSFQPPEEDSICECQYDEIHDRMDREDCPFHCDLEEDLNPVQPEAPQRKPPGIQSDVPIPEAARKRR